MNEGVCLAKLIQLFEDYRESFGLCDHDLPGAGYQERQTDYEEKFTEILCEYYGHDIGPDQCGKPEHDFCYRCNKLASIIRKQL